mgnify:CR=1 FL=1
MKQHLYTKLLILYFMLGGICFLLLSSGGSYLVEKRLERSTGESLYRTASQLVSKNELRQASKKPKNEYPHPRLFPLQQPFKMQISGLWIQMGTF